METVKPRVKLVGTDGNIFAVLGVAVNALREAGQAEKADELKEKVFHLRGDYYQALAIILDYVDGY